LALGERGRKPMAESRKPVIGLIGGIGSGKSLVAAEFVKHGGRLISGDALGHEALRQPDIMDKVSARWGKDVVAPDGSIDRRQLGRKVFADLAERRELERLVFPYIERRIREEIEKANTAADVAFIVLDAAIMLETGWNNVCHSLVYIDVPRTQRLVRLAQQRGWTDKEVTAREAAQMPLEDKKRRADFVVDNSGTIEATARQVAELVQRLELNRPRERRI
jgi:dephospho-CoA kinase